MNCPKCGSPAYIEGNSACFACRTAPALAVAAGSPAAGRVDILRKEVRRWWRLEQKAVLRRDYLAAHEYAQSYEKYGKLLDAAEQENAQGDTPKGRSPGGCV